MPTITKENVQGYAHCRDSLCEGNAQDPVSGVRERSDTTYAEVGGDMPGIEKTVFRLEFADAGDVPCPVCGVDREIADQVRPVYPSMVSAFSPNNTDQRFLLQLQRAGKIVAPGEQAAGASEEVAELRRELAELRGFIKGQHAAAPAPPTEPAAVEVQRGVQRPPRAARRRPEQA